MAGVGAAIVLAFVMAGDLSGRAESAAPAGIAAKPKEAVKATKKRPRKQTAEKGAAKSLRGATQSDPPSPCTAAESGRRPSAGTPAKDGPRSHARQHERNFSPCAHAAGAAAGPRAWRSRPRTWPPSRRPSRWRATARPARSPTCREASAIPSPASWSNGCCCAATTIPATIPAMPPSSAPIRAGRASVCCGAGPRPWCGRSSPSRPSFARSLPRSRRCRPRAIWRWHARCWRSATRPARKRKCARLGATRPCPWTSRIRSWTCSRTF